MTIGSPRLRRLRCSVQNYGWGRIGPDAAVAKLYAANSGASIDSSDPYAEFWMGTHGSGPSFVTNVDGTNANGDFDGKNLKEWISENPSVLGDRVLQQWGCDIPFLFKVLSVAKPLSIQAHPDKALASELHKLHPDLYKDDNHKPVMALALTEFEALCGFLEIKELKEVVRNVPEVEDLIGPMCKEQVLNVGDDEEEIKAVVKSLFAKIMSSTEELVSDSEVVCKLKSRFLKQDKLTTKEQLILRVEEMYPSDVGVIVALLMNHVKLQPGEAIYLEPNELHAYVSGDCVECMATSDNVVRAGLTPKEKDVNTLCSMLTYNLGLPHKVKGTPMNEYTTRYNAMFEEFEVDKCIVPEKGSVSFPATWSPSILVVMDGAGEIRTTMRDGDDEAKEAIAGGDVFFAPAYMELNIRADSRVELYRAGVNSKE